jgi:hypothetical protein
LRKNLTASILESTHWKLILYLSKNLSLDNQRQTSLSPIVLKLQKAYSYLITEVKTNKT